MNAFNSRSRNKHIQLEIKELTCTDLKPLHLLKKKPGVTKNSTK